MQQYKDELDKIANEEAIEEEAIQPTGSVAEGEPKKARQKLQVLVAHNDIIRDAFWSQRPWILQGKAR